MQYPICIEWGDDFTATGIQIPDIPGAVTAGDSFEEAYNAAVEVAQVHGSEGGPRAWPSRAVPIVAARCVVCAPGGREGCGNWSRASPCAPRNRGMRGEGKGMRIPPACAPAASAASPSG